MISSNASRTIRAGAHRLLAAAAVVTATIAIGGTAEAAVLNDRACKGAPGKNPVVLVHGRGGDVNQMTAIRDTLAARGHCVFGTNYGQERPGGPFGHAHLDISGEEIKGFIQGVLQSTGAKQVDVIGHSAGTGVLANYIMKRGGAAHVRRLVSFGGLHHPYAHVGLANVIDATLFLPNTIRAIQDLVPPFTSNISPKDIMAAALGAASSVGAPLSDADRELVQSGFVSDLFDPKYWNELHGGLSEQPGVFIAVNGRPMPTKDAAPNVCYTNIVGVADLITGTNAGFQDEAPNVDNFLLTTLADHSQILADPLALAKMASALASPCVSVGATPGVASASEVGQGDGEGDADPTDDGDDGATGGALGARGERKDVIASSGCAAAPTGTASPASSALIVALAALARRVRLRLRRSSSGRDEPRVRCSVLASGE